MTLVVSLGLLACGGDDVVLRSQADPDQPALDTAARSEPDQTWDGGVTTRDIRWNYVLAMPLHTSISVVGSFRFTIVNSVERAFAAGFILRFIAPDGERHVAEIPFSSIAVPADSLLNVRENFILEIKDQHAANNIQRMEITLF